MRRQQRADLAIAFTGTGVALLCIVASVVAFVRGHKDLSGALAFLTILLAGAVLVFSHKKLIEAWNSRRR